MWLLPSVDQVVFLQVSQLSEAFATGLTFERSLPTVDAKMNLRDKKRKKKNQLRPSPKPSLHANDNIVIQKACRTNNKLKTHDFDSQNLPSGLTAVRRSCCTRCTRI